MKHEDLEVTLAVAGASGNKNALYRLGEVYAQGEEQALMWHRKAAEVDNEKAAEKVVELTGHVDGRSS